MVFDNIIPIVLTACQPREIKTSKKNKDFSLDSDSEDEEVQYHMEKITEHDEKASAIQTLGQLAKACPVKFTPYFEAAYKILD